MSCLIIACANCGQEVIYDKIINGIIVPAGFCVRCGYDHKLRIDYCKVRQSVLSKEVYESVHARIYEEAPSGGQTNGENLTASDTPKPVRRNMAAYMRSYRARQKLKHQSS